MKTSNWKTVPGEAAEVEAPCLHSRPGGKDGHRYISRFIDSLWKI